MFGEPIAPRPRHPAYITAMLTPRNAWQWRRVLLPSRVAHVSCSLYYVLTLGPPLTKTGGGVLLYLLYIPVAEVGERGVAPILSGPVAGGDDIVTGGDGIPGGY